MRCSLPAMLVLMGCAATAPGADAPLGDSARQGPDGAADASASPSDSSSVVDHSVPDLPPELPDNRVSADIALPGLDLADLADVEVVDALPYFDVRYEMFADAVDDAADATLDAGPELPANLPPIPKLFYEIELSVWVEVKAGDTVVRPLDADINWGACSSHDPDGEIVYIRLSHSYSEVIQGNGEPCGEHDQFDKEPHNNVPAYLLVRDDDGAESKLNFFYTTN